MVNSRSEALGRKCRGLLLVALPAFLSFSSAVTAQEVPGIYRQVFSGVLGENVATLTNNAAYPDGASDEFILTDFFETPINYSDGYGQRLRAILIIPEDGDYTFFINSEDQSLLYFSEDEDPNNMELIAAEPVGNSSRNYYATGGRTGSNATLFFPSISNPSLPVNRSDNTVGVKTLSQGQRCYIEVLHKEGAGGDNLSLAWIRPGRGGYFQGPIPGGHFVTTGIELPYIPNIVDQPQDTTIEERDDATFFVSAKSLSPLFYQWRQGGVNVGGATSDTFVIEEAGGELDGLEVQCVIYNSLGTNISDVAVLTVNPDVFGPEILSVSNEGPDRVLVTFNESLEPSSALAPGNYTIGGVSPSQVTFVGVESEIVALDMPISLETGSTYLLEVTGVRDATLNPNPIEPGSQFLFTVSDFAPWTVGDPSQSGMVAVLPDGFDLTVASAGVYGSADQFLMNYQKRTGDFDMAVRVDAVGNSDPWARGGLMARSSLQTNSVFAAVFGTPSISGVVFSSRASTGAEALTSGSFPANYPNTWLRLRRTGGLFVGYASYDGSTWYEVGRRSVSMPAELYVGMAASSRNLAQATTVSFRSVQDVSGGQISAIRPRLEPPGPSTRRSGLTFTEIMYHPADRLDGLDTEFVEIFNSNPISEELSGYRLSGDIDYTFPEGTRIPAGGYLVVAREPSDLMAAYGLTGVLGPYDGSLPNDTGRVRLRHFAGEILLETNYESKLPWPVAADGAGPSLVLRRPSYGEGNVQAWSASTLKGGSPGRMDGVLIDSWNQVVINEWLAHTDLPQLDFVELHNTGLTAVDIGGAFLSDDRSENKFQIPEGTILPAGGFTAFTEIELGFRLSAAGERIFFVSPDNTRVIDAVSFEGQENGVATGRSADGAPDFTELQSPTFGAANAAPLIRDVVINEIMYHPIGNEDAEYVELFNKGAVPVDLSGWKFVSGIDYTIPTNTVINPGAYLVIAKDATLLQSSYLNLNSGNLIGNFSGSLGNSSDRVALAKWDTTTTTNLDGSVTTEIIHITVDEVAYVDGERWGRWADGDGSSLELVDPRSDNRRSHNWAGSDETNEADWVTIEHTGVLDNGRTGGGRGIDELQVMLLSAGEVLVDDIEVIRQGGGNVVPNGTFGSGIQSWIHQGNHVDTGWNSTEGSGARGSLHLRASGGGDNGANRVKVKLNNNPFPGETVTIRARARWISGSTNLLLRLYGNYLEASGELVPTQTPGTPGLVNSRYASNAGPAIWDVTHDPVLPAAGQSVLVTARVSDPDGVGAVLLRNRQDPVVNHGTVTMNDDGLNGDIMAGDGVFSGRLPGRSSGVRVAFYVEATDGQAATARFPLAAPEREALVQWGDQDPFGNYGTYRFWMTEANIQEWDSRPKLSNHRLDMTFVYGNYRVIYNGGIRYRGSPWLRPSYSGPMSGTPALVFKTPSEEPFIGFDEFNLDWLEQPGRDPTLQREKMSFWIGEQLGVPFSHQRYIYTFINGRRLGQVYTDSQEPSSSDYISAWFDDDGGDIYKIDDWFEFNDVPGREFNENARLLEYTTTGGEKKKARYRWSWEKKSNRGYNDDYSSLFELVDVMNQSDPMLYEQSVRSLVDVEQWLRVFATRRIVGDWDGYSYERGKNMSTYKIPRGRFHMLLWDLDFSLGGGSRPTSDPIFDADDPVIRDFFEYPAFRRLYLQIMREAAEGPLSAERINPVMDENYRAFQESAVVAEDPSAIKSWVAQRRFYLLNQADAIEAPFEITTNNGFDYSTRDAYVQLEGRAPLDVRTVRVNGVEYPLKWSTVNSWELVLPLQNGVNNLLVEGFDREGQMVAGAGDSISISVSFEPDSIEDHLVISEMMYNATVRGADYIELLNTSTSTPFELTGVRINGLGFTFPSGTVIFPGEHLVVADNLSVFASTYGYNIPVAGEYSGEFDAGGETISLIREGSTPSEDVVLDSVFYDDDPPWPALADGQGSSLQLRDALQDNNRVGNWLAGPFVAETNQYDLVSMTHTWKYEQSGNDLGSAWREVGYDDSAWPSGPALLYVEDAGLPAPKNTPLTLGPTTFYFRTSFNSPALAGNAVLLLSLIVDDGVVVYLNGEELHRIALPPNPDYLEPASRTVGNAVLEGPFEIPSSLLVPGMNQLAVEVHQTTAGSSDVVFGLELGVREEVFGPFTPGAGNYGRLVIPAFPNLWLNEVQPNNITGLADGSGERDPWLELYNGGQTVIDLSGLMLSDSYVQPDKWAFPTGATIDPGQFMVVWLDGEPNQTGAGEYHTSFRISTASSGGIALSRDVGGQNVVMDYLTFDNAIGDRSFGLYPDGQQYEWAAFYSATPGAANDISFPAVNVFINEWMADNTRTLVNPLTQQYDDWFELYNAGGTEIDLSGYFLTDNLAEPSMWQIPLGTTIPAGGFLVVWADDENTLDTNPLHTNFRLSNNGEAIGLFSPALLLVDQVMFGGQGEDLAQGRFPDGMAGPYYYLTTPTPGAGNRYNPPVFLPDALVQQPDGSTRLSWSSEPGRTYRIHYKDDLSEPVWQSFGEVLATGFTKDFLDNSVGETGQRYYLVELLPE